MKKRTFLSIAVVAALLGTVPALAQFGRGAAGPSEVKRLVVIRADGSCAWTNQTVEPRKTFELQVSSWQRYAKMSDEGSEGEDGTPVTPPATAAQKTFTDEELAKGIREMYQQRSELGPDVGGTVDQVEVSTNSVRVVTSHSFASLKELLGQNVYLWGPDLLMPENTRVEIDTNRNLQMTFMQSQRAVTYRKNMSREWRGSKSRYEWKLVLPGKILKSGLPGVSENSTWLSMDYEKPETLDAAFKLVGSPVLIKAEPAGIKLEEPLESRKLVRANWSKRNAAPDLPITEAGPGFVAEPTGIAISTVYQFPEGEKYFKNRPEASMWDAERPGAVVSAKLFPPKGRQIRTVSAVRVKSAKDDQGRPIGEKGGSNNEGMDVPAEYMSFSSGEPGSEQSGAARLQLQLSLPAPDAKSIDELQCEAVALTIGGWKEMVLTNVVADPKKEIDLGEVLAGAKLIIKKVTARTPQKSLEASLEGPPDVKQLELKIKTEGRQGGSSHMSERRTTTSGSKTIRNLTVQAYEFGGNMQTKGPVTLMVRYPQDFKRERVQFKLTGLDLL